MSIWNLSNFTGFQGTIRGLLTVSRPQKQCVICPALWLTWTPTTQLTSCPKPRGGHHWPHWVPSHQHTTVLPLQRQYVLLLHSWRLFSNWQNVLEITAVKLSQSPSGLRSFPMTSCCSSALSFSSCFLTCTELSSSSVYLPEEVHVWMQMSKWDAPQFLQTFSSWPPSIMSVEFQENSTEVYCIHLKKKKNSFFWVIYFLVCFFEYFFLFFWQFFFFCFSQ